MKKSLITIVFLVLIQWVNAQSQEGITYQIKESNSNFNKNRIAFVDEQMFDLYRSANVDNEVIIISDGQTIKITLLSAEKMKALGFPFNEDFVRKGAIMSGDKANVPRSFTWGINEKNEVNDLTEY